MVSNVIVALDFLSLEETENFLDLFEYPIYVKVGMSLFYKEGPKVIQTIKERGHKIFLDLKLHDIPNTVYTAMMGLKDLGVDMVNVHAAGGIEMMRAARKGLGEQAKLIAVTQLTSTSQASMQYEQGIQGSLNASVLNYTRITEESGLDGVVCSPLEVTMIKESMGDDFLFVTPGIRLPDAKKDDQVRITTPVSAKMLGSTHIVVGRPITQDSDPKQAYETIVAMWEEN